VDQDPYAIPTVADTNSRLVDDIVENLMSLELDISGQDDEDLNLSGFTVQDDPISSPVRIAQNVDLSDVVRSLNENVKESKSTSVFSEENSKSKKTLESEIGISKVPEDEPIIVTR